MSSPRTPGWCSIAKASASTERLSSCCPGLVVAGALVAGWLSGGWILATTYLYWQWFHYTRQSYGIERAYRRRATNTTVGDERLARWALYLLPRWGIVHRSVPRPETFLGVELRVIPIPPIIEVVTAAVAIAALVLWAAPVATRLLAGERLQAHTLYVVTHFVIFSVGYLVLLDIGDGWLVVNVWHNAQYILFVWMFNNQRFRDGESSRARLLSYLSQRARWPLYIGVCDPGARARFLTTRRADEGAARGSRARLERPNDRPGTRSTASKAAAPTGKTAEAPRANGPQRPRRPPRCWRQILSLMGSRHAAPNWDAAETFRL